jgi:hypothetical protein
LAPAHTSRGGRFVGVVDAVALALELGLGEGVAEPDGEVVVDAVAEEEEVAEEDEVAEAVAEAEEEADAEADALSEGGPWRRRGNSCSPPSPPSICARARGGGTTYDGLAEGAATPSSGRPPRDHAVVDDDDTVDENFTAGEASRSEMLRCCSTPSPPVGSGTIEQRSRKNAVATAAGFDRIGEKRGGKRRKNRL